MGLFRCAVAELNDARGALRAEQLAIVTGAGSATGQGSIDAGAERLALISNGTPEHPRVLQLNAPVTITGPSAKPVIKVQTE